MTEKNASQSISENNPLATDEQLVLERLANEVFESNEVREARELARKLLLADPTAQTLDGAMGLDRALDQWVMGQIAATINADPARPRLLWAVDNTPREWAGHVFMGAAVAIDNPDNVNRVAPLNGDWDYVLEGQFGNPATGQTSFSITLAESGQLRWGDAVATLTNENIKTDEQGRFTITMDKNPANGRDNHMPLVVGPLQLAIRDSHSDWGQQATAFTLKTVAGPQLPEPVSLQSLITESAEGLIAFVTFWLGFKNSFWDTPEHNKVIGPLKRTREGGWGTQAGGRFLLNNDDEALVITTSSGGAKYTGFQISDPWTISPTPIYQTTSRNLAQISANADGTFTYVISLVDPGVVNWINTAGLHEGWFMLRWQNLPPEVDVESLVLHTQVVKLSELGSALPAGCPAIDLATRQQEILLRIDQHGSRSR